MALFNMHVRQKQKSNMTKGNDNLFFSTELINESELAALKSFQI